MAKPSSAMSTESTGGTPEWDSGTPEWVRTGDTTSVINLPDPTQLDRSWALLCHLTRQLETAVAEGNLERAEAMLEAANLTSVHLLGRQIPLSMVTPSAWAHLSNSGVEL